MTSRRVWFVLGLLCLALLLAACGEEDNAGPPPAVAVTLKAPPQATVLPGCQPPELESWYEVAGSLVRTFRDESADAVSVPPAQLTTRFERLQSLRDTIAQSPTPECALEVHSRILSILGTILADFQQYINGDLNQEQLSDAVTAANAQIDGEIASLLAATGADLETQLREGSSGASDADAATGP